VRPGRDLIAIYPTRDHPAAPDPETILQDAKRHVDLLIPTFRALANTHDLAHALIAKARDGCAVRVLATRRPIETPPPIAEESNQLMRTLRNEGVALRQVESTQTVNVLIRADDSMLVTLYHYPRAPAQSPYCTCADSPQMTSSTDTSLTSMPSGHTPSPSSPASPAQTQTPNPPRICTSAKTTTATQAPSAQRQTLSLRHRVAGQDERRNQPTKLVNAIREALRRCGAAALRRCGA